MDLNYLTKLIIDHTDEGIIIINRQKNIIAFNPASTLFSSIEQETAVGKPFLSVLSLAQQDSTPIDVLLENTLSGHDSPLNYHAILVCQSNIDLPIIFRLIPISDKNGQIKGCLFIFRDEQLDRYKTDFLSVVAHQLKTPLGSMRWNLEALLASDIVINDIKISDVIRDVYNSNSRLISLIDDLLNASRIDSRKVVIKPEPTDVTLIINQTLKELTYQIQQKQLTINQKMNFKSTATIDSRQLREVIENLLSNAIKYNHPNGTINITTEADTNSVIVTINDSGIGIPDTELPRIFSKSFRAKNAVDTQIDGSGLGLYVAKSFVEDWGGVISCQSTINHGTTISFTIPLVTSKTHLNKNLSI